MVHCVIYAETSWGITSAQCGYPQCHKPLKNGCSTVVIFKKSWLSSLYHNYKFLMCCHSFCKECIFYLQVGRIHTLVIYLTAESLHAFRRHHCNMIHLGLKVSALKSKMIFCRMQQFTSSVTQGQRALTPLFP